MEKIDRDMSQLNVFKVKCGSSEVVQEEEDFDYGDENQENVSPQILNAQRKPA